MLRNHLQDCEFPASKFCQHSGPNWSTVRIRDVSGPKSECHPQNASQANLNPHPLNGCQLVVLINIKTSHNRNDDDGDGDHEEDEIDDDRKQQDDEDNEEDDEEHNYVKLTLKVCHVSSERTSQQEPWGTTG